MNFEVWIIDGGSVDGTQEFLKTLSPLFNVISEKDTGIYNAMNKGIKRASGDWLYFMGADDELFDTSVFSSVASQISSHCQLVLGDIAMGSSDLKQSSEFSGMLWVKNTVHHQGVFYHKGLFQNNQYDEALKVLADYKFNIRLYKENIPFKKIDQIIARCGDQGVSKNYNWTLYKEEIFLKVGNSYKILWPIFFKIAVTKFIYKKIRKVIKDA